MLLLMMVVSTASLASPFILSIIIDKVFPAKDYEMLIQILAILVLIYIIRIGASAILEYLYTSVGGEIMTSIRKDFFNHLIKLPIIFFNEHKNGDIVYRIHNEVDQVQNALTGSFIKAINSGFTVIGITIMLCILNYNLFFITIITFPFIFLSSKFFYPKIRKAVEEENEENSALISHFSERFANIKLIKTYNTYICENEKLKKRLKNLLDVQVKRTVLSASAQGVSTFFIALGPVLVFGLGGKDVLAGSMTLGALVAFIQYLSRLFPPLKDIIGLYSEFLRTSVSTDRIFEFMEKNLEENEKNSSQYLPKVQEIEFRNINFSFNEKPVLRGIDIKFTAGKKYALVGRSGCGKSTILNLICKFYNPTKGNILVNGQDIKNFDLHRWRDKVIPVFQENQIFNDTISENIRYGNTKSSNEQVIMAANNVDILDHIENMKATFETQLGEKGINLSSGQKQRIALARALLKKGEIIILDEATSGVDSVSEEKIIKHLFSSFKDEIIITVSHRLSTIKNVDMVFCIDQGKVIESGTFRELLIKNKFFVQLFNEQLKMYGLKRENLASEI